MCVLKDHYCLILLTHTHISRNCLWLRGMVYLSCSRKYPLKVLLNLPTNNPVLSIFDFYERCKKCHFKCLALFWDKYSLAGFIHWHSWTGICFRSEVFRKSTTAEGGNCLHFCGRITCLTMPKNLMAGTKVTLSLYGQGVCIHAHTRLMPLLCPLCF